MGEFLRLKPPTFAGSSNPLDADDWLRMIKRKLEAIGCLKNQRVQLAAHQLSGMALAWWDTFSEAVRDATWAEFETAFREHHVPQGTVQLKEDEFRELTQGGRTVSEYVHKFTELAKWKGQKRKKKGTLRGNSRFSELSSKTVTRELDPLGFQPGDQASLNQLDLLCHATVSRVRVPSRPPLLQATNRQQMPVGTVETPVTSRITAPG
jgi:hypothetical protein